MVWALAGDGMCLSNYCLCKNICHLRQSDFVSSKYFSGRRNWEEHFWLRSSALQQLPTSYPVCHFCFFLTSSRKFQFTRTGQKSCYSVQCSTMSKTSMWAWRCNATRSRPQRIQPPHLPSVTTEYKIGSRVRMNALQNKNF